MADTSKIEAMLESLVNDDKAKAEELFHEFVIEKSRDIYEGLLENDLDIDESDDEEVEETADEEVDEATDEEVDESDEEVDEATDEEVDESDEEVEENFDEFEMEADDDMGGDPADDMMGDMEAGDDDEGMDDAGEDDMEDRVVDLEDALDELKAEFEKMMGGEEGGDDDEMDMGGEEGDMDMDDMGGEEEPEEEAMAFEADEEDEDDEDEAKNESKSPKSEAEQMREYVEKVAGGHGAETKGKGESGANTKSPVAGKNDMGGTAGNIVAGGEESGGKAQGPKEDNAGNVNVPGGKASKSMSNNSKGHGAEKKGSGETGTNSKSLMGS